MKNISKKISGLLSVKTLVTLMLSIVFCILSLKGIISPEQFMTVFTVIIGSLIRNRKDEDNSNEKLS